MDPSYLIGWVSFRLLFKTYFRARFFNPENVPSHGPVILASNHASYLDPPLIGAGIHRPVAFLARDSLFRFPVMSSLLRSWRVVPVDRDGGGAAGLRMILDRLWTGAVILVFPEGTRSHHGEIQRARSGIGLTVIKSSAPVVPARVFGTFEAYGRRHKIPRPLPVAVKYGKPLLFTALRTEATACSKSRLREIYQEIADELMTTIKGLEPCVDKMRFP